jgi:hypothetical protein
MTPDQIKEACEVVDELNSLYFDQTEDENNVPFDFVYSTYWMGIKMFDVLLWDSEDYGAERIDNEDEEGDDEMYESLYSCVMRRATELSVKMHKFTLEDN